VASDSVELLMSQNPLEYFGPVQSLIDIKELVNKNLDFMDEEIASKIRMFGFQSHEGMIKLTFDSKTLQKMDMSGIPKPGLRNLKPANESEVWDDLGVMKLDGY
jgi:hypothetical protein